MTIIVGILAALLLFLLLSFLFKRSPVWAELPDSEKADRLIAGAITWAIIGAALGLLFTAITEK